jgi:hypothetical protein
MTESSKADDDNKRTVLEVQYTMHIIILGKGIGYGLTTIKKHIVMIRPIF